FIRFSHCSVSVAAKTSMPIALNASIRSLSPITAILPSRIVIPQSCFYLRRVNVILNAYKDHSHDLDLLFFRDVKPCQRTYREDIGAVSLENVEKVVVLSSLESDHSARFARKSFVDYLSVRGVSELFSNRFV